MTMPQHVPNRAAVEEALQRALARPEFAAPEPGPIGRLAASIRAWFGELRETVLRFFSSAFDGEAGARDVVLALAAAIALTLILRAVWRALVGSALKSSGSALPIRDAADGRSSDEAARQAFAAAAAGRREEAMHALYRAVLLRLDERGLVRWNPARTGGEVARALQAPEDRDAFRALVRHFYPVAFGGRAALVSGWRAMASAAEQLEVRA